MAAGIRIRTAAGSRDRQQLAIGLMHMEGVMWPAGSWRRALFARRGNDSALLLRWVKIKWLVPHVSPRGSEVSYPRGSSESNKKWFREESAVMFWCAGQDFLNAQTPWGQLNQFCFGYKSRISSL